MAFIRVFSSLLSCRRLKCKEATERTQFTRKSWLRAISGT